MKILGTTACLFLLTVGCTTPDRANDDVILRRLDTIEQRLGRLEGSPPATAKANALSTSSGPSRAVSISAARRSELRRLSRGLSVYFGNLHSHTSYSDGSGTPEQAYAHARRAGLDFLAITEHNHKSAESGAPKERRDGLLIATRPELYKGPEASALIPTALRESVDGGFVALYGQEFSSISSGNHVNVFEIPDVLTVPNGEYKQLVAHLGTIRDSQNNAPIVQFNHPALGGHDEDAKDYGQDDFDDEAMWVAAVGKYASLVEIINGPSEAEELEPTPRPKEAEFKHYLSLGFKLAPTADQDNHFFTWGTATHARTAVIAKTLTRAGVLDAMRRRNVYATTDANLRAIVHVNEVLCGGDVSAAPNSSLKVEFTLQDDDEPNASYKFEVFRGVVGGDPAKAVKQISTLDSRVEDAVTTLVDLHTREGREFYYFRITQDDGDRVWTAPVWIRN